MTDFEKAQRHLRNAMNALSCLGADDLADMAHNIFKENSARHNGGQSHRVTELNDSEVAVLIDSLAWMRDGLRREGMDAPNVESALDKVNSLMAPDTTGLYIGSRKS